MSKTKKSKSPKSFLNKAANKVKLNREEQISKIDSNKDLKASNSEEVNETNKLNEQKVSAEQIEEKNCSEKAEKIVKEVETTDTTSSKEGSKASLTGSLKKNTKPEKEALEPLHFGKELKKRIGSSNPAILKFVAAIPILGAATALKNGILISIVLLATVVILNMIMYPLDRYIKPQFKYVSRFLIAGIVITPFFMLSNYMVPNITQACEIYLPLTAICAIPMIETKYCHKKYGFLRTVLMAVINGLGFTFAALLFSVIRECLGKATLYERPLPFMTSFKLPFIIYPTGAFILLGFLAALWRKIFGVKHNEKEE